MSEATQDSAIHDLSVELAVVAGRLVSLYAATGLQLTRAQIVESVLRAIEDAQTAAPDGVASLAKARRARGLPALARPIEPAQPVATVEVNYVFHGRKAEELGRLALQLYGETTEAA